MPASYLLASTCVSRLMHTHTHTAARTHAHTHTLMNKGRALAFTSLCSLTVDTFPSLWTEPSK